MVFDWGCRKEIWNIIEVMDMEGNKKKRNWPNGHGKVTGACLSQDLLQFWKMMEV